MPEHECRPVALTFVVPARNEERYIGACVEALRVQDFEAPFEIVVVDNGSSDHTAARAREAGARVVFEPRPGLANARQAGLDAARGALLIFVDADTRLPAGWARSVAARFEDDERLVAFSPGFTFYDGRFIDDIGGYLFRSLLCPLTDTMLRIAGQPGILIGSAIAARTEALRRANAVDLAFQFYGEDTAMACRLRTLGDVRFARGPHYATSARRYQQRGLVHVVFRYFSMFALIHLGRREAAARLAKRFHDADVRERGEQARGAAPGRASVPIWAADDSLFMDDIGAPDPGLSHDG